MENDRKEKCLPGLVAHSALSLCSLQIQCELSFKKKCPRTSDRSAMLRNMLKITQQVSDIAEILTRFV